MRRELTQAPWVRTGAGLTPVFLLGSPVNYPRQNRQPPPPPPPPRARALPLPHFLTALGPPVLQSVTTKKEQATPLSHRNTAQIVRLEKDSMLASGRRDCGKLTAHICAKKLPRIQVTQSWSFNQGTYCIDVCMVSMYNMPHPHKRSEPSYLLPDLDSLRTDRDSTDVYVALLIADHAYRMQDTYS